MKIRGKIYIIVLVILFSAGLINFFMTLFLLNNIKARIEGSFSDLQFQYSEARSNEYISVIKDKMDYVAKRALSVASLFTKLPVVEEAYSIAFKGNIDDPNSEYSQQARDLLRNYFAPIIDGYTNYTGEKLLKLHFHLPNARSLVRLWRKGYQTKVNGKKVDISDDISLFRRTVVKVNTPPYNSVTGIEIGRGGLVIRGVVPITSAQGKHLGSVEVLFPFSEIIGDAEREKNFHYAVFMDYDKLTIAKSLQDPEKYPLIDKKYVMTNYSNLETVRKLIDYRVLDMGHRGVYTVNKGNYSTVCFPIKDFSNSTVGVFAFSFDLTKSIKTAALTKAKLKKAKEMFILITILTMFGVAAVGLIIIMLVVRKIVRPLSDFNLFLQDMASGSGDLTRRIEVKTKDEVKELSRSFNTFVDRLKSMILKVKDTTQTTVLVRESLSAISEETLAAITEMTANIKNTRESIHGLKESLGNASSSGENIKENIKELDEAIEVQYNIVRKAVSSINDMMSSIEHVGIITKERQDASRELVKHAEQGEDVIGSTIMAIREINDSINSIYDMVNIINNVASQTNILAMNAAIEAAHAGEAGKGFSVVADEIRKLAEDVSNESKEISSELEGIVERINRASEEGERANKSFLSIRKEVDEMSISLSEIYKSTTELTDKSNGLVDDIERINMETDRVKRDSDNMTANITKLTGMVSEVDRIADEVVEAIDEIFVGTEEINRAMRDTMERISDLAASSFKLKEEVDNFQI